jgi:outer membrane protein assembly factor BamB
MREVFSSIIADPASPQFIAHVGDLFYMMEGAPVEVARRYYESYRAIVSEFDLPVFNLIGNHDQVNGPPVSPTMPEFADGLYEEVLGPTYYSFDWGEIHFVVLNSFEIVGKTQHSRFSDRQLRWLANDLAHQPPQKPLILFTHRSPMQCENERDLLDVLEGHDVLACFAGDWHRDAIFQCPDEPFPTIITVGPLENIEWMPSGYRIVSVRGAEVAHTYRLMHDPSEQIYVVRPAPGSTVSDEIELVVTEHLPSNRKASPAYSTDGETWTSLLAQPLPGQRTAGCEATWAEWRARLDASDARDPMTLRIRAAEGCSPSAQAELTLQKAPSPVIWRRAVAQSGDTLWRSQPVVAGSCVVLGEDTGVRAFSKGDGRVVWEHKEKARWLGTPGVADGRVIVTSWESDVLALDIEDGSVIWRARGECAIPPAQPCVAEDVVVVGGMKREGIWDGSLTCISLATGDIRWTRRYDHPFFSTPLQVDGHLWASCGDVVHCIDVASGCSVWSYYPEHFSLYPRMVLIGRTLFAPDGDGWVYVLDSESGALLDRFLTPRGTGFITDGERIYAACGMRGLRAYEPATHREAWCLHRPGSYFAGRPTLRTTDLLATSSDGNIYAVDKASGDATWSLQFGDVGGARVAVDGEKGYFITGDGEVIGFSLPRD